MNRKPESVGVVSLLVLACFVGLVCISSENSRALTAHSPIVINGNSDFTPANGVTRGNGTADDPYVIEGWSIHVSGTPGIQIHHTDAFFMIFDVLIHGPSGGWAHLDLHDTFNGTSLDSSWWWSSTAMRITDSGNIWIEGNDIFLNGGNGIRVMNSANVTIADNVVTSNGNNHDSSAIILLYTEDVVVEDNTILAGSNGALEVLRSEHVRIENNTITDTGIEAQAGIYSFFSSNVDIVRNIVSDNDNKGIYLVQSSIVKVQDNTVKRNGGHSKSTGAGIGLALCLWITIERNAVFLNPEDGISISGSVGILLRDNSIFGNTGGPWGPTVALPADLSFGLRLSITTSYVSVYHNYFINNYPNAIDEGSHNSWDDGYPSGGNYWSSYGGVDQKSGPDQDLPGSDGIGDTPYEIWIDSEVFDNYPLMSSPMPDVLASVQIIPKVVNVKSEEDWITAKIQLEDGYDIRKVVNDSLKVSVIVPGGRAGVDRLIPPESIEIQGKRLVIRFNRSEFTDFLLMVLSRTENFKYVGRVELAFSGSLAGNLTFGGSASIKIINPPGEKNWINQYRMKGKDLAIFI